METVFVEWDWENLSKKENKGHTTQEWGSQK